MATPYVTGPIDGRVRFWNDDEGWGVVDSPGLTGGCWVHFSVIESDGFRSLTPGGFVKGQWESAEQDGYAFRARSIRLTD